MARQAQLAGVAFVDELSGYDYQIAGVFFNDLGAVVSDDESVVLSGFGMTASLGTVIASAQQTSGVTLTGFGMTASLGIVDTGVPAPPVADRQRIIPGGTYVNEVNSMSLQLRDAFVNSTASQAAATTYTFTGPTSGNVGQASSSFTVTAVGVLAGAVTVTPTAADGSFAPPTSTISPDSPSATFTYTPASAGSKTISVANNGGLSNPDSISFTAVVPIPAPTGTITTQTASGSTLTVSGTTTGMPTSATASLPANIGGATVGPVSVTLGSGTFTVTLTGITAGTYTAPVITLTNSGGVATASGGSASTFHGISGGFTAI
jgi:hypothetical protein